MPVNDGQEGVTVLQMDIQLFAEGEGSGGEAGSGDAGASTDTGAATSPLDALYSQKPIDGFSEEEENEGEGDTQEGEPGSADQGDAEDVPDAVKGQSPEANRAFAEMRKRNEQLESQIQRLTAETQRRFGISSIDELISGWDRTAQIQQQQQAMQQQQQVTDFNQNIAKMINDMRAEGYSEAEIQRSVKAEVALFKAQQMELKEQQREQQRQIEMQQQQRQAQFMQINQNIQTRMNNEFAELQKEYPEFKNLTELAQSCGPEVWQKISEKWGNGYSMLDAYESENRQALKEKATAAVKQQTLNQVNGRAHLKPSGGRSEVDTLTIPEETLKIYKQLNPGKTHKEYLEHYRRSQKG